MKTKLKNVMSLCLAFVMILSVMTVAPISVSAASVLAENSSEVGAGNEIYFDVKVSGWGNVKTIYCHIWKADGTATSSGMDWPAWQTKAEKCKYDANKGIATYDLSQTGHSFSKSDGKIYCVIFSANTGMQTYNAIMSGKCIGDTLYCTGNKLENPEDSAKTTIEASWRNNPDCGAEKKITSTGKVIGKAFPAGQNNATMMATYLIAYYDDPAKTDLTGDLMKQLNLTSDEVMVAVNKKLAATGNKDADKISKAIADILAKYDKELPNPSINLFQSNENGLKIGIKKVEGVAQYRVYCKNSKGQWTKVADTKGLSVVDKNVTAKAGKTYTVKGFDSNGNAITGYNSKGWYGEYTAPTPSINLLQSNANGMKIGIKKTTGVSKYRVYCKNSKGQWTKVGDTTGLSVVDQDVTANASKTYTVKGIDSKGNAVTGYNSKGWSAKFVAPNPSLTLKNTKNGVNISWKKIAGVAKYRVYYKNSKGQWTRLSDTSNLSYLDKSIKNNTKRTYTIRGLDKKGNTVTGYNSKGWTITCKR